MNQQKEKQPSHSKSKRPYNDYLKYSNLALQIIAMVGGGAWIGNWLDKSLEFKPPVFTLLFSTIAIFASMYWLIKSVQDKNSKDVKKH